MTKINEHYFKVATAKGMIKALQSILEKNCDEEMSDIPLRLRILTKDGCKSYVVGGVLDNGDEIYIDNLYVEDKPSVL